MLSGSAWWRRRCNRREACRSRTPPVEHLAGSVPFKHVRQPPMSAAPSASGASAQSPRRPGRRWVRPVRAAALSPSSVMSSAGFTARSRGARRRPASGNPASCPADRNAPRRPGERLVTFSAARPHGLRAASCRWIRAASAERRRGRGPGRARRPGCSSRRPGSARQRGKRCSRDCPGHRTRRGGNRAETRHRGRNVRKVTNDAAGSRLAQFHPVPVRAQQPVSRVGGVQVEVGNPQQRGGAVIVGLVVPGCCTREASSSSRSTARARGAVSAASGKAG
jgi:hypothetical protein